MSVRLPDGPMLPDTRAVAATRRRLRAWYRRRKRDLPWRRTRDPWPVWVSEVMLQQTQVATATPFYQRFLERFPTLESLARAPIADVLTQWAGLGYYRRARYLHEAARTGQPESQASGRRESIGQRLRDVLDAGPGVPRGHPEAEAVAVLDRLQRDLAVARVEEDVARQFRDGRGDHGLVADAEPDVRGDEAPALPR